MTSRRMLHLPAALLGVLPAAVLMACAGALLAVSEKAEATFPGKNGRIAANRERPPMDVKQVSAPSALLHSSVRQLRDDVGGVRNCFYFLAG